MGLQETHRTVPLTRVELAALPGRPFIFVRTIIVHPAEVSHKVYLALSRSLAIMSTDPRQHRFVCRPVHKAETSPTWTSGWFRVVKPPDPTRQADGRSAARAPQAATRLRTTTWRRRGAGVAHVRERVPARQRPTVWFGIWGGNSAGALRVTARHSAKPVSC